MNVKKYPMKKIISLLFVMMFITATILTACTKHSTPAESAGEFTTGYDYSSFIGEWQYDLPDSAWGIILTIDEVRNNNEMDITLYGYDLHENLPIVNNQVTSTDMINLNLRHNSDTYLVELTFFDAHILATVHSKERYVSDDYKKESELKSYVDEYRLTSDTAKPKNITSHASNIYKE